MPSHTAKEVAKKAAKKRAASRKVASNGINKPKTNGMGGKKITKTEAERKKKKIKDQLRVS